MRVLTSEDVSSILRGLTPDSANQLLDSLSSGLASYFRSQSAKDADQNRIIQPARTIFQTDDGNTVLTMPVSDSDNTVVKVVTVPAKGDIAGATTIYNSAGELQAVLNAAEITAFRTALASMAILVRWKAPETSNLCVFGSGKQAEWHLRLALLLVPGIKHVAVFNRGRQRLEEMEKNVISGLRKSYPNVTFETFPKERSEQYPRKLMEILPAADIICCCTPSTSPLFSAKDLLRENQTKDRFMSLIGSYKPHMMEIDTDTIELSRRNNAKIWVDLKDACLEEAGELIKAGLGKDDLTEIGELFSEEQGRRTTLEAGRQLTLFKCVGFGFMDLVISKALLDMAKDLGKGVVVEKF